MDFCPIKEVEFSRLKSGDLSTIPELHALFPNWKKDSILKKVKKTFKGEDLRFVARKNGKIVAHVKLSLGKGLHRHRAEMTSLAVAPTCRRKGIATQLVKFAVEDLPDRVTLVTLAVDKKNKPAITLYKYLGFTEFGLLKNASIINGKHIDNCLMQKSK